MIFLCKYIKQCIRYILPANTIKECAQNKLKDKIPELWDDSWVACWNLAFNGSKLYEIDLKDIAFMDMGFSRTFSWSLVRIFGTHWPEYHVQQCIHQAYLRSFTQYCFEGLPSAQTAPAHPFPCWIPFIDVGWEVQSYATKT